MRIDLQVDGCDVQLYVHRGPTGAWECHQLCIAGPVTTSTLAHIAPARRIREWAAHDAVVPPQAPDTPEAAATVYKAARRANQQPRQAVMRALGISQATATRRLRVARDLGLLDD